MVFGDDRLLTLRLTPINITDRIDRKCRVRKFCVITAFYAATERVWMLFKKRALISNFGTTTFLRNQWQTMIMINNNFSWAVLQKVDHFIVRCLLHHPVLFPLCFRLSLNLHAAPALYK
ncbi:hypothetical protein HGRIS_012439 [Hohenbuehelia grisea]|uniref:Uncharacterized protein n=1 Tax=Hohenbuehelia grisea TaxID=104357 RepID=A0ABR3ISB3_9AGAR